MDFKKLADRAKGIVQKRGGTESLKEDAGELKDIATGEGSLKDKAKAAAEAVKDPGATGEEKPPAPVGQHAEGQRREPGERHGHGEHRGEHERHRDRPKPPDTT